VAGGVFAQEGEWSLGASVSLGTRIDFDPIPDVDDINIDPVGIGGLTYEEWDSMRGAFSIGYTKGALNVSVGSDTKDGTGLAVAFDGENFRGQFRWNNFLGIVYGLEHTPDANRLWGEYKMFNGMLTLVAAYRNADTSYWVSNTVGSFVGTNFSAAGSDTAYLTGWKTGQKMFAAPRAGYGDNFTHNDNWMGNDIIVANASFGGLEFGILLPNVMPWNVNWGVSGGTSDGTDDGGRFVNDTLKKTILGVKFDQAPFVIAAQFNIANYGVYFGGEVGFGPITVGLSAMGVLDGDGNDVGADADPQSLKIGGGVSYNGAGFGGGLNAFYSREDFVPTPAAPSDFYLSLIGVEPFFFIDAIPSSLQFRLDVGFYFANDTDGNASEKATVWAIQPQIFYNFLGTGATSGPATGIIVRYRMASADVRDLPRFGGANNSVNFADILFKLSL